MSVFVVLFARSWSLLHDCKYNMCICIIAIKILMYAVLKLYASHRVEEQGVKIV